jgi:isohexenylglutaconyl-CoA hydratase
MEKQFFVYILASGKNGTLYVGVTSDLVQRVWQHKSKVVEGFTKKYGVDQLVWFEAHDNAESAIAREKQIKEWKRQWKRELIEKNNPAWRDLYEDICGESPSRHSGESRNPVHPAWEKIEGLDTGFRRYDGVGNMAELPETPTLLLNLDKGVLHLTFNRPESRNAMSPEMLADIEAVFSAIADDESVRAVVLRGAGGHFCAGADLKSMMGGGMKPPASGEKDPIADINRAFGSMLRRVQNAPQVVIAVCEGAVLGGGFGLACVSDIAFAHTDAKFGMPETTRGLPPAQIAPFVVERIGLTQARRLALTGAQFRGAEALRLGLVHEGFASEEELQAKLADSLKQVLGCAPKANAVTKAILLNVGKLDMDAVLDDAAAKFAACVRGPEAPEGITAFMQKRAPKWAQP